MDEAELRDDEIKHLLATLAEEARCSWCGTTMKRPTKGTRGKVRLCRGCRRAKWNREKAATELKALPADAAAFDRSKLKRELAARHRVLELRRAEGDQLNAILDGLPTSKADLEKRFEEIGKCIGRKPNVYGQMATVFGLAFSDLQIRWLLYLFWKGFHADCGRVDVKSARRKLLLTQNVHCATD